MAKSNRISFTASRVEKASCEPGKAQSFLWDSGAPGLGLRMTQNKEGKAYIFESRVNSKTLRITIGSVLSWTIDAAQAEARRLQSLCDQGIDPRQQKSDEKAIATARRLEEKRKHIKLGDVWPVYIEERRSKWGEWHIRDHEEMVHLGGVKKIRGQGLTQPGALAALLPLKLSELTVKRVASWLAAETLVRPTKARLAYRLLSVFVNWCESQDEYAGLIPAGVCKAKQVKEELAAKNTKDDDCLQSEQLPRWFAAVRGLNNPSASVYLQGLLITGARRRELADLLWDDINFEWNSLTIRDKVEGERTIPLTPYFKSLLQNLPRRNKWVFSSASSASGKLVEPTGPHRRVLEAAELPHLSLHGLRRSFTTLAEWVEVPVGVTAQIMGHKPTAIAELHYKRRKLDILRRYHIKIEQWMLEQAGVEFHYENVPPALRLVA
nr:integrase family protein [uncultured Deefgea sp.]